MKVLHCDICDTDINVHTERFEVERKLDASGSPTTTSDWADLCPECFLTVLKQLFKSHLNLLEVNKGLMNIIKTKYSDRVKNAH